jgi:glycosyltransferase involved in cell wall biosynthesis
MRILWHSNAPWAATGYGTQTAQWVPRLAALGHEVAISAFYGLQGGPQRWHDFLVYPRGDVPYGSDVVGMHARHFRADLVLTLMDQWVLSHATLDGLNVACWMPVDAGPLPNHPGLPGSKLSAFDKKVLDDGKRWPIAMTRFGQRVLDEAGYPALYVPHGIDTDVFRPPNDRKLLRESMGLADKFVIGIVAANMDKARKGWPEQFAAFAKFHVKHPDSMLLCHTADNFAGGLNLRSLAERMGIGDAVNFSSQYLMMAGLIRPESLAPTYAAMDLLSACSLAEGFGLPIVEAMACGTPVVVTDGSAMSEVAGPKSWKVPGRPYWATGHESWWAAPDIDALARIYEKAYERGGVYQAKVKAAREHAMSYDADRVQAEYMEPALKELEKRCDVRPAKFSSKTVTGSMSKSLDPAKPDRVAHRPAPPNPLSDVSVSLTAWRRPYYLKQVLASWERARGFGDLRRFVIGLGGSPRVGEARDVIAAFAERVSVPVELHEDDGTIGPWRALAANGNRAFEDPGTGFIVVCEEDILVADDVLEMLAWQRREFQGNPQVLLLNLHSRCGQGWDGPSVADDPAADPAVVRLLPYFNQWGWGTWRECWEEVLIPDWDYDGTSGLPHQSGSDWNIALRTMKGYLAAVPDASRTQHIGDQEPMFANASTLAFSKAASFREHREPVSFAERNES